MEASPNESSEDLVAAEDENASSRKRVGEAPSGSDYIEHNAYPSVGVVSGRRGRGLQMCVMPWGGRIWGRSRSRDNRGRLAVIGAAACDGAGAHFPARHGVGCAAAVVVGSR